MSDASPAAFRVVAPGMRALGVVLWIAAAVMLPVGLAYNGPGAVLLLLAPSAFVAWFAWVVLWRPCVRATSDALVVVDVRRTTSFSWPRVLEVRSRYGLEVVSSEGERRVWIATRAATRLRIDDASGSVRSDVAGVAARLSAFLPEQVETDDPPPERVAARPIVHRVHGWDVAVLVVLGLVATIAGGRL